MGMNFGPRVDQFLFMNEKKSKKLRKEAKKKIDGEVLFLSRALKSRSKWMPKWLFYKVAKIYFKNDFFKKLYFIREDRKIGEK